MTKSSLCYCGPCNLEFSSTVFQCCPVCLTKVDETSRRLTGRLAFLFQPIGENAEPIIRMHADQKRVHDRLMHLCGIVGVIVLIMLIVGGANAWQAIINNKGNPWVDAAALAVTVAFFGLILALIVVKMKNHNPVEILPDGRLRIPRGMSHSRSVTCRLVQTIATASRTPEERSYHVIPPDRWLQFVDDMGRDESLSLVKQFEPIVGQFFGHVDSQIQEIRYAFRDLAKGHVSLHSDPEMST